MFRIDKDDNSTQFVVVLKCQSGRISTRGGK